MLSIKDRFKLMLILTPAILVVMVWVAVAGSVLSRQWQVVDLVYLIVNGLAAALVSAYFVTSFITYHEVLSK